MKKFCFHCARAFWLALAAVLVVSAVLVQVAREFSPVLNDHKDWFADKLAEAMGSDVSIGALDVEWQGLSPSVTISNLAIFTAGHHDSANPSLAVGNASLEIDLLRSAWFWRPVMAHVTLHDAHATLTQGPHGDWQLAGFKSTAQTDGTVIDDPMDIFLLADRVESTDVLLDLKGFDGDQLQLNLTTLQFENKDDFHRVSAEVMLEDTPALQFVMEALGDPRAPQERDLKGYLVAKEFPARRVQELFLATEDLFEGATDAGNLNAQIWFSSDHKGQYQIGGDIGLAVSPMRMAKGTELPNQISTQFAGDVHLAMPDVSARFQLADLSVAWPDFDLPAFDLEVTQTPGNVELRIGSLDAQKISQAILRAAIPSNLLNDAVGTLQASGKLTNLTVDLPTDDPGAWRLRAEVDGGTASAWRGTPVIQNASGFVNVQAKQGYFLLNTDEPYQVHFSDVFDQPFSFDRARGAIGWDLQPDNNAIYLTSGKVDLAGEYGAATGYFRLYLPWKQGSAPMDMTLYLGLTDSSYRHRTRFIPKLLDPALTQWLDESIKQGEVSEGGFIFRGRFTGPRTDGNTQLWLSAQDGAVDFHPDWPGVRDLDAELVLDNTLITAVSSQAKIYSTRVESAVTTVDISNDSLRLDINGVANGPSADGIRALRETPLREFVGKTFDDWILAGDARTHLTISQHLMGQRVAPDYQRVAVAVQRNIAQLTELGIELSDVTGSLTYNSLEGISSDGISATLWQKPLAATISTSFDDQQQQVMNLAVEGRADVRDIEGWLERPEFRFADGETAFSGSLAVPLEGQDSLPVFALTSDMLGLSIDLPGQLHKPAATAQDFSLTLPISDDRLAFDIKLANQAVAIELLEGEVASVGVALGGEPVLQPGFVTVTGSLADVDLDSWLDTIERYERYSAEYSAAADDGGEGNAQTLEVSAKLLLRQFAWGDLTDDNMSVQIASSGTDWLVDVNSNLALGRITVPEADTEPMLVDLDYLYLPESDTGESSNEPTDPLADLAFADLPSQLVVSVDDFAVGAENYGAWEFNLANDGQQIKVTNLFGLVRGAAVRGHDGVDGQGAELTWSQTEQGMATHFHGRVIASDLREVLYLWQQPELVQTSKAVFDADLSWAGSPAAIDYVHFSGDLAVDIEHGRFLRTAEGGGDALLRLVALFNFDSWARRLRLGVSDIVDSGMAFDNIDGQLNFNHGELLISEPIRVKAPSSKLSYAGRFDLINEDLDTTLVATLPVGGNLTLVAALAGGLPAAAGVYVASKLFRKQVDKVASVSYRIQGGWDDPNMKFVRLFDDGAADKAGRDASSAEATQEPDDSDAMAGNPPLSDGAN